VDLFAIEYFTMLRVHITVESQRTGLVSNGTQLQSKHIPFTALIDGVWLLPSEFRS